MPRLVLCSLLILLAVPTAWAEIDATAAFEKLKSLEGTWQGEIAGMAEAEGADAEGQAVTHVVRVSANGSVIMETMNPGSPHEMINMYHLDGEELVLTHYCAGGNQPTMRLDRQRATAEELPFDFTGGTNLDPEIDGHIHEAHLRFDGANTLESRWISFDGGEKAGEAVFLLRRVVEE